MGIHTLEDPLYYPREFTLKDGSSIIAKLTNKEMKEMLEEHPEIEWIE